MGLTIIVLVKQVPDTNNITANAMKPDGTINRAQLPAIVNPEDLNALEAALTIKDQLAATIVAITLGPPSAINVLKQCLYRGADDAILITDPKFAASDTAATSYALACAIKKIIKFDLIFCGRQAIDGDTAQIGPQVAEKLAINQITYCSNLETVTSQNITIKRTIDGGYEIVKSNFPVLVTVTNEANEPRSANAKRAMMYKNIETTCSKSYTHINYGKFCSHIKQWNVTDIEADPKLCGLEGSPTKVKKITNVALQANNSKEIANTETGIKALLQELINKHIIG